VANATSRQVPGSTFWRPRMPTRRPSCWRPRARHHRGLHGYRNARIDGRPQARPGRRGPMAAAPIKIIATSGHYVVRDGDLPFGCSCQNLTALPRFPAPCGTLRPRPRTRPPATPPSKRHGGGKKIEGPLETGSTFSSFLHAATSGPGALRGPGGDGRRRCPTPARTHLAQRRIWL
jgi:hypothetical protein